MNVSSPSLIGYGGLPVVVLPDSDTIERLLAVFKDFVIGVTTVHAPTVDITLVDIGQDEDGGLTLIGHRVGQRASDPDRAGPSCRIEAVEIPFANVTRIEVY